MRSRLNGYAGKCRRVLSILIAISLICVLVASCSSEDEGGRRGGTEISLPGEGVYDFTAFWLKSRTDVVPLIENWRVGVMGNSVRVTAGRTAGTGIQSAGLLPESYVLHTTVSLENIGGDPFSAGVRLGAPENEDAPAVVVSRSDRGVVRVEIAAGDEVLCESAGHRGEDAIFSITVDNSYGDGRLRLFVSGDGSFTYNVLTDEIESGGYDGYFSLFTDTEGIVFMDIGVDTTGYRKGDLMKYAQAVLTDFMGNYWDAEKKRLINTFGGRPSVHRPSVWEVGVVMFAMETMYRLTGDESLLEGAAEQWKYMQSVWTDRELTAAGSGPNPAVDDAGWTSMSLMTWYRMTGDEHALKLARTTVRNGYRYWMDGSVANGLWNSFVRDGVPWRENEKTIYAVGLLLTALDYHEATAGTELEDEELFGLSLDLYNWIETFLLRDREKTYGSVTTPIVDGLYYYSFWEKEDGRIHPESYNNISIMEGNTNSSIMGNTAMAVIHSKLYDITGMDVYRERAVNLANAIAESEYGRSGILISDFDPWVNASFMGRFVSEVLTLPGISGKWSGLLRNTAISIMLNARTADGYYKASWIGSAVFDDPRFRVESFDMSPEVMMTSTQTVHMVIAAALGEKLGIPL